MCGIPNLKHIARNTMIDVRKRLNDRKSTESFNEVYAYAIKTNPEKRNRMTVERVACMSGLSMSRIDSIPALFISSSFIWRVIHETKKLAPVSVNPAPATLPIKRAGNKDSKLFTGNSPLSI